MRVLHVITGLASGGAEQQLRLLCRVLGERGVRCEVAVLYQAGTVAQGLRRDGVAVHDMRMRGNRDLTVLPRLVRLMRRGRYDVVHTHLFRAGLFGRLAARLARVPAVVATEHSLGDRLIEGRPTDRPGLRALYLAAERLGDRTIAVSEVVAERMRRWGVPAASITVIPDGVDAAAFAFSASARRRLRDDWGVAPDTVVVGCVGRLVETKRFDLAVQSLVGRPERFLVLVGAGPAASSLAALAERCGVADRVRFLGEVADVAASLSAVDVFLSPSPEETYGLAVVEALAAGLQVVYVACPALDGVGDEAVPEAVSVGPTRLEIDRALRSHGVGRGGGAGRGPAPVTAHHDVRARAREVEEIYRFLTRSA